MFKVINKLEKSYDSNILLRFENIGFENQINICEYISDSNQKLISEVIKKQKFTAKKGELLKVEFLEQGQLISLIIIGMGKSECFNNDVYREVIFNLLFKQKGTILLSTDDSRLSNPDLLAEVVYSVNYNFDTFKEKKEETINVELFTKEDISDYSEALILGEATNIARELVNLPANVLNPLTLSDKVVKLGEEYGFEVEILDDKKIEELGMQLLYNVGKASVTKPRLIIMRHLNGHNKEEKIGLVGKGLTYDTGGLCIKPADSMMNMKDDMAGAAAVIGAMCAISKRKLNKNVVAVIPACENAINGNSCRPGDIIKSMNGKTVEIVNTDAEGRLALADAITYSVRNEKVTELVDIATLTGAMVVALGNITTGVFANSDEKYFILKKNSNLYGEKIWRLPLFEQYGESLSSLVADIKHMGNRMGGSISAAKFLEVFAEGLPWIHMDIAGTSFDNGEKWLKKGGSGVGVKTLYGYVKNR